MWKESRGAMVFLLACISVELCVISLYLGMILDAIR